MTVPSMTFGVMSAACLMGVLRDGHVAAVCKRCGESHFECELPVFPNAVSWLKGHLAEVHEVRDLLRVDRSVSQPLLWRHRVGEVEALLQARTA